MNKEQFGAISLPYELMGEIEYIKNLVLDPIWFIREFADKAISMVYYLRPLSDLTKPIEHNGEMFVPIKELCNLYGAKFDKPYQNNMCAGFIYGFAAHDVLNLKNIEKNEFWKIHKLIEWHFDIVGLIEKGEAIDVNTLPKNPYK